MSLSIIPISLFNAAANHLSCAQFMTDRVVRCRRRHRYRWPFLLSRRSSVCEFVWDTPTNTHVRAFNVNVCLHCKTTYSPFVLYQEHCAHTRYRANDVDKKYRIFRQESNTLCAWAREDTTISCSRVRVCTFYTRVSPYTRVSEHVRPWHAFASDARACARGRCLWQHTVITLITQSDRRRWRQQPCMYMFNSYIYTYI